MCVLFGLLKINLAAAFWINCRGLMELAGRPVKRTLSTKSSFMKQTGHQTSLNKFNSHMNEAGKFEQLSLINYFPLNFGQAYLIISLLSNRIHWQATQTTARPNTIISNNLASQTGETDKNRTHQLQLDVNKKVLEIQ